MHDALAGRTGLRYGPLDDHDKQWVGGVIEGFVRGDIDEMEVIKLARRTHFESWSPHREPRDSGCSFCNDVAACSLSLCQLDGVIHSQRVCLLVCCFLLQFVSMRQIKFAFELMRGRIRDGLRSMSSMPSYGADAASSPHSRRVNGLRDRDGTTDDGDDAVVADNHGVDADDRAGSPEHATIEAAELVPSVAGAWAAAPISLRADVCCGGAQWTSTTRKRAGGCGSTGLGENCILNSRLPRLAWRSARRSRGSAQRKSTSASSRRYRCLLACLLAVLVR